MDHIEDPLQSSVAEHVDLAYRSLDLLYEELYNAIDVLTETLLSEHRILVCGSGVASALGQVFCASLLGQQEIERPALPAICLSTDQTSLGSINDHFDRREIYSRQISALGQPGDCLLAIASPDIGSDYLIPAVRAAQSRDMRVLVLSAQSAEDFSAVLEESDVELQLPESSPARALECQLMLLNILSSMLEKRMFGLI